MTREMRKSANKAPKLLLILVIGWVPLQIFHILLIHPWFSIEFSLYFLITILVILADAALFILSIIVVVVSLFRWLIRRERPHVISFLPLAIMLVVKSSGMWIPSKTARAFYLHRDEFIALADSSASELQDTDKKGFRLPESPLYELAGAYRDFYSNELVIEFIIDDYFLPLVYISTDNPNDVHNTCSRGGVLVERLEPKWYVCRRDRN